MKKKNGQEYEELIEKICKFSKHMEKYLRSLAKRKMIIKITVAMHFSAHRLTTLQDFETELTRYMGRGVLTSFSRAPFENLYQIKSALWLLGMYSQIYLNICDITCVFYSCKLWFVQVMEYYIAIKSCGHFGLLMQNVAFREKSKIQNNVEWRQEKSENTCLLVSAWKISRRLWKKLRGEVGQCRHGKET